MDDSARRDQFRTDARIAAHHGVAAKYFRQQQFILDPILQSQDGAARVETSLERMCSGGGVVGFHAKQDEVVGREIAWLGGGRNRKRKVPLIALELEAPIFERPQ